MLFNFIRLFFFSFLEKKGFDNFFCPFHIINFNCFACEKNYLNDYNLLYGYFSFRSPLAQGLLNS